MLSSLPRLAAFALAGCLAIACAAQKQDAVAPDPKAEKTPPAEAVPPPPRAEAVALRFPRLTVPWLGIEMRASPEKEPGVEVVRILAGSPAETAGIAPGDVIVSLGQSPVLSPVTVADWVSAQEPGSNHPVTLLRQGKPRLLRVTLEGRPEYEDQLRLQFVGRPAPEIAGVATFQGEASSLSELRGQVVVLEFWASFCGVCRFLGPRLDRWHRIYQPQGAEVVGITVDPPHLGMRVAARFGMSYTLASDVDAKVTETYMASQIPAVIIIDRKGIVRDAMVGYSEARLKETEALLAELIRQES